MKRMRHFKLLLTVMLVMVSMFSVQQAQAQNLQQTADSLVNTIGVDLFDEEIDAVIFQTNEFLTDATFIGASGPFWWILEMCMALGALFAIIMAAGMAYKMMVKGEPFDVLKILRVLGIAIVMFWWYPHGGSGSSVLGVLAYVPNCIGSYTHDLYEIEAAQVQEKFDQLHAPLKQRQDSIVYYQNLAETIKTGMQKEGISDITQYVGFKDLENAQKESVKFFLQSTYAGFMVGLDKFVMFLALIAFRVGWWGTIFCQQVLLGMLTIFGPLQWAFSILPKWEGAWAKWITRYLTVHFYGAMLYFVGFYVLLLFDIVLSLQYENLQAILGGAFTGYLQNAFMTAGYLLIASLVALKCLNLVPDLAAWMIPEGDTAFSTRNFGEGVASEAKRSAMSVFR